MGGRSTRSLVPLGDCFECVRPRPFSDLLAAFIFLSLTSSRGLFKIMGNILLHSIFRAAPSGEALLARVTYISTLRACCIAPFGDVTKLTKYRWLRQRAASIPQALTRRLCRLPR